MLGVELPPQRAIVRIIAFDLSMLAPALLLLQKL